MGCECDQIHCMRFPKEMIINEKDRKKKFLGSKSNDTLRDPKCQGSVDISHGFLINSCCVNTNIKYSGHNNPFIFFSWFWKPVVWPGLSGKHGLSPQQAST